MKKSYAFPYVNNGESLVIHHDDERFIDEVLARKEYEFLSHYPVVIDIGANIGTFSLYMQDKAEMIYAVEPIKDNIENLLKTIKENNFKNIHPVQLAISDASHVKLMQKLGTKASGSWKISEAGNYEVKALTLEDFMVEQKIEYADLVKIDVEGHEHSILSCPLFPVDRIGTIIGELHQETLSPNIVKPILEWMGYRYYDMPGNMFLARKV